MVDMPHVDTYCIGMTKTSRPGPQPGLPERLRLSRAALFETAADAARALGMKPVTVRAHENGQNGVNHDDLRKYATLYNVTPEFLLYGVEAGSPVATSSEYQHLAGRAAAAEAKLAYLKDGLRKLLEGLG